ncbi:hypothetical protein E3N88_38317 [Mikania micrantha]|uniref:Uncharacterized protein n=1 Tax=Mikania micrantha TaxID=192012 RepID=A0A5N6LTX0_9ASTR|nr:hypothetical protein E3N88_38317 [Mikania micrantha]
MYLTIVYVIARLLDIPELVPMGLLDIPELLSAYMRYAKAKHESIDSKLLPGYKGHVIARLLDIPELVSAYMRYVNAKHKRNVTELLPGYKGHVIARLLDIPELLSAYKRRYVIAKLWACESMMLDKRNEKLTLMNTIDMKTLKQITRALMRIELIGRLDSGVCPIYKHTDLDITCGVNEVKVLPKEVKNRFKLKLLDMHTRLPR